MAMRAAHGASTRGNPLAHGILVVGAASLAMVFGLVLVGLVAMHAVSLPPLALPSALHLAIPGAVEVTATSDGSQGSDGDAAFPADGADHVPSGTSDAAAVGGVGGDAGAAVGATMPPTYVVSFDTVGVTAAPRPMRLEATWDNWPLQARGIVDAADRPVLATALEALRTHGAAAHAQSLPFGMGEGASVPPAARLDALPALDADGYELVGWRANGEGELLAVSAEEPLAVLSDVTLVAQWRTRASSDAPTPTSGDAVVPMDRLDEVLGT